jgi:hypothetical protein
VVQTLVEGQIAKARRGRRVVVTIVFLGILATGGAYWYSTQGPGQTRAAGLTVRAAVPVSVATAVKRDMPIYLTGLGTVQAILTVGIHSVVDGTLPEVLFTEGQDVKKGDPAGRDRFATLPARPGAGARTARARPGTAQRRGARSGALQGPGRHERDSDAAI